MLDACMENGWRALCLSLSLRFSTPSGTSKDGPRSDVSAERPPRHNPGSAQEPQQAAGQIGRYKWAVRRCKPISPILIRPRLRCA